MGLEENHISWYGKSMSYWTVDIPYHSHRWCRASKFVAAMGYIWKLCSHSSPIQQIASAFLPIHFPYVKMWQNWAPYQFHIFTQSSHTIPRYGSYMAHVLPYHSHTFSLVRVIFTCSSTCQRWNCSSFPLLWTEGIFSLIQI